VIFRPPALAHPKSGRIKGRLGPASPLGVRDERGYPWREGWPHRLRFGVDGTQ